MPEQTDAERAIDVAMHTVEQAGADVRLTDACNLLWAAREAVADFVDGIDRRRLALFADQAKVQTWHPMATAPQDGTVIDLVAKHWNAETDTFEFRRFPATYWYAGDPIHHMRALRVGLDDNWRPVGWMPIPVLPEQDPQP